MLSESSPPPLPPPLPPALPPPLPPLWSALVVPVVAIIAALTFAGMVQGAMMFTDEEFLKLIRPPKRVERGAPPDNRPDVVHEKTVVRVPDMNSLTARAVEGMLAHQYGVAVLIVPGQLMMAATLFGAVALSPRRMKARLGYVRSALPWWMLPILILTTIFFGFVGGIIVDRLFPGPHPVAELFVQIARSGTGVVAVLNLLLLSIVPGFVEESLFRGYVQRRLLERWAPLAAIAVSSVFFCAAHFDPQHVIAVVPVGIWLGVIAWRSAAVWPGMICHAVMNASSMAMMRFGSGDPNDHTIPPWMQIALAVGAALVVVTILLMRRYPPGRLATVPGAA